MKRYDVQAQMSAQDKQCARCIWNECRKTGAFMCVLPQCVYPMKIATKNKAETDGKK